MPATTHQLTNILRAEIEAAGPISCARFMELALYHPVHGYYRQPLKQIGCQGDFYTSLSVGPLFGQLLASQFSEWLGTLSGSASETELHLVEAGAHEGRLALDILSWFEQRRSGLLSCLQYWILEPSAEARRRQQDLLGAKTSVVRWAADWKGLPSPGVRGIIFSNELLDAFPVYRVGWDARNRRWFEWRIIWAGHQFAWTRSLLLERLLDDELAQFGWLTPDPALAAVLPDGFTVELCPAARIWWSQAAGALTQGKLMTFDYGFAADEFFVPHRPQGTFRSYRNHHLTPDPLTSPGEQDLTAHVNFSSLQQTGESAGLRTECFLSQAAFLTQIASRTIQQPASFGPWDQSRTRQLQTLTHPDHLGHAFRVLVQSR